MALDDAAKVKELYDRTLRDYAYMFSELLRQKTLLVAEGAGLTEDINRLKAAQENALKLTAHRQQELEALGKDAKFMERDRQTIEKLLATVQAQLAKARELVATLIPENARQAQQYIESQIAELESGPVAAPASGPLTGVQP
ncbi:MAG: hypothetical protein H0T51_18480 [Pirellulales bacterium]|nr:hypothetical protein [Pirellulales bacterium]